MRLIALLLVTLSVSAQDVLTIGSGSAASGGTVSLPISIRDATGTVLGTDAGTGQRIQSIAFKVMFPASQVSAISFTRAGVIASLTPLYETTLQGSGWLSYVVSFSELTNAIPFPPNTNAQVGTLSVTLSAQAAAGSTVPLTLHPPSAVLSNQAGSTVETIATGALSLVNGSISVVLGIPSNVVATATGTTQVDVTWNAVTNADHYEVWRSVDGGAYGSAGTPAGTSLSDTSVVAGKTYLYKVRAVDAAITSGFSSVDPATTILFTDDPLVAQSTLVKTIHFTQLRSAVNAFRVSAGLAPLASDPSVATGLTVQAHHVTDLRTALDAARSAATVSPLTYTDVVPAVIKAVHVEQLRNGVR